MRADLVREGKLRGLGDWGEFDVYAQRDARHVPKKAAQTRRVLTWEMADGKECVKARLVATGFRDPDLREGIVDTSGCVCPRSSHLQVISISAIKKWKFRRLGAKHAFLQSDGFGRDVLLRAPDEWDPSCHGRAWKSKAPAYGLNDAPVAFRRSLKRHLFNVEASLKCVGLLPGLHCWPLPSLCLSHYG